MSKKIAELICPECNKDIKVPFEVTEPPTLDEISNALKESLQGQLTPKEVERVIREQLEGLKPGKEDHRHKTADELLDCPECRSWFDQTSQRYQVAPKEKKEEKSTEPVFEFGSLRPRETE